jgi:hypothetical protein
MTELKWITNWEEIDNQKKYITCPINTRDDGSLYLAHPSGMYMGWAVRRLMERCYAALEMPEFKGVEA